MKIEARIFELLTVFFIVLAVIYAVFTGLDNRKTEWVGVVAVLLAGGLVFIIGTYFRFVARRIDTRPEDYDEAEISDGAGDLGFFSPHSWWPVLMAFALAFFAIGFALWLIFLIVFGIVFALIAIAGLVFEYYVGAERH